MVLEETGQTCPRCGSTGSEVEKAVHTLDQSLAPLGIEVVLQKETITPADFANDVLQSNMIWIEGKPLEEWLKGRVGQSTCCDVCGDAQCRTIELDKQTYEVIPAILIVRAGLVVAA